MLLNIQTFPTQSIFTWNHNSNSMVIKHSSVNLPELSLHSAYEPIALLTKKPVNDQPLSLSKQEMISLFHNISKGDLDKLLHPQPLSPLDQEY